LRRYCGTAHWIGVGAIGAIAWLFKYAYAQADATQLQGLLYPLAMLLNTLTPLQFVPLPSGEWWDARHQIIIVKACAGGNFLLVSWLGYAWQWRQKWPKWQKHWFFAWSAAGAAAWATVLIATSLRVLILVSSEESLSQLTGLSAAQSHRLIGIVVYFSVLVVQMAGAIPVAVVIYLGVTVLLPVMRAFWVGWDHLGGMHLLWTASLPLLWLLGQQWWRRRDTANNKSLIHLSDTP
jgi:exosortase K